METAMVTTDKLGEQAAQVAKLSILRAIDANGHLTAENEARVQRALDLLRAAGAPPERKRQLEAISCTLETLHGALMEGRVNFYASALLRLRKAAEAL
jgi:hypothetical protein